MGVRKSTLTEVELKRLDDFLESVQRSETYGDISIQFVPESVHDIEYENVTDDNGKVVNGKDGKPLKREKDRVITKFWEKPVITSAPDTVFNMLFTDVMQTGYNPADILSQKVAGLIKGTIKKRLEMDTHDTLESLISGIVRVKITDAHGLGFVKVDNQLDLLDLIASIPADSLNKRERDKLRKDVLTTDGAGLRKFYAERIKPYLVESAEAEADAE